MIYINKKVLLVLATLLAVALMIGVPLSAAASPATPAYLAGGSSMNYVTTSSGYTYYHNYTKEIGGESSTTVNNVTAAPCTYYYNVSVVSSNSTVATVTVPESTGTTTIANLSIADAKYIVPVYLNNTPKNVTMSINGIFGYYFPVTENLTFNYTSTSHFAYYKSDFGSVRAVEYILSATGEGDNYTGTLYVNPATNMILGLDITTYYTTGTVAANGTYTNSSSTISMSLTSTNVVPITTDYTGAYVGIGVAIVLLGITVYYFYGRKH